MAGCLETMKRAGAYLPMALAFLLQAGCMATGDVSEEQAAAPGELGTELAVPLQQLDVAGLHGRITLLKQRGASETELAEAYQELAQRHVTPEESPAEEVKSPPRPEDPRVAQRHARYLREVESWRTELAHLDEESRKQEIYNRKRQLLLDEAP